MNNIVITLLAKKPCEINNFLSRYYNKDMQIEEGAFMWTSLLESPLESICLLATLMDNIDDYKIDALISVNHYNSIKVSENNINDIVKFLYFAT